MSAPLTLVRLRPDLARLAQVAAVRRWSSYEDDFGYTLHAALAALFGAAAPRPFALRHGRNGAELLGYARSEPDALRDCAALPAVGDGADLHAALAPAAMTLAAMPTDFIAGRRLGFEVRLRPVRRVRAGRDGPVVERDAYLHARDQTPADARDAVSREAAYHDWLAAALGRGGAATIEAAALDAYRRSFVLRRPPAAGERRLVRLEGPDATLRGTLVVGQPAEFAALLRGGVGRHRAFGFGMLLLAPPGRLPGC